MKLRILLFSALAALVLYLPFYYFAPFYRPLYAHVPIQDINWWGQYFFRIEHGGIQIYIAYVLMYMAIGLTACFEYIYLRFIFSRAPWVVPAIGAIGCFFYLRAIGFYPPMAAIRLDGQGILFITAAASTAFILGRFFDHRASQWLLIFLLSIICMVPGQWSYMRVDYFYILAPALRALKGYAFNQSYFQYDQLTSLLAMAWMKFGLPADRFLNVIDFSYLAFFVGVFFLAKSLFFNKRLAIYFVLSLVIIKIYGNLGSPIDCPQVSPLRLDMWLVALGLVYWKGPQHWLVGAALGFFLVFHHTFGMIYGIAYVFFVFTMVAFNIPKNTVRSYLPNAALMFGGMLMYQIFISSNKTVPSLDYLKYNIGFMPIDPTSFFWYVPVLISATALLLWKTRGQPASLPQRYFQAGIFLVLLAIGNLLYFFGRSHENNLINVASSLWLVFFMLLDLIVHTLPQRFTGDVKKYLIPLAGVLIVGVVAFYYSGQAPDRIKGQASNLSHIGDLFKPDQAINFDFDTLKRVTNGNRDIVFLSLDHDFDYYYYGGYDPVEFCPLQFKIFLFDLMTTLNNRIAKGADIIVPMDEYNSLQENILTMDAKYSYRISDFYYISNNKPAI